MQEIDGLNGINKEIDIFTFVKWNIIKNETLNPSEKWEHTRQIIRNYYAKGKEIDKVETLVINKDFLKIFESKSNVSFKEFHNKIIKLIPACKWKPI